MNKNIRGIQVSRNSDFVNIGLEVDNTGELFILQVYCIKPNDAELYEDYPFECMGMKFEVDIYNDDNLDVYEIYIHQ